MAWTQADLDRVNAALASSIKSVTFADGRRTEYHSLEELRRVRAEIKAELLASASQVNPFPRATRARMRRR